MKKIYNIKKWCMCLALILGCIQTIWAYDPGVLHLKHNSFTSYINMGVDLKNDLLDNDASGIMGEATMEFWIKSTQNGNEWELTDMNSDATTFALKMHSNNKLDLVIKAQTTTIDLGAAVSSDTWYHVALVITQNGTQAQLIINGQSYGSFPVDFSDSVIRDLYFHKPAGAEIFLTEVRFWATSRTNQKLDQERWKPYVKKNTLIVERQTGLVALYADNTSISSAHSTLNELNNLIWLNFLDSKIGAKCVSDYNDTVLATVFIDPGHPILSNKQVFLSATKGNELKAYENQIQLSWNHLIGATKYQIIQTDSTTREVTSRDLTYNGNPDINFFDDTVIPGRLYTYQVVPIGVTDAIAGNDQGFVYYNGSLEGRIASQVGSKPIQEVEVTMHQQQMGGSAIKFANSSQKITAYNLEAFRNNSDYTITFWYKSLSNTNTNEIFTLGSMEIKAVGGMMQIYKEGAEVMGTTIPDTNWHHYAFVFAHTGTIYIDAQIGSEFNNPAPINLSSIPANNVYTFELNTQTGSEYWLDEFRIWDWDLANAEAKLPWHYNAFVQGNEADLIANYRFDMTDTKKIFNLAETSRGDIYTGETSGKLTYINDSHLQVPLVYKSLTDINGDYAIFGIDHNQNTGKTFDITPSKAIPNYPSIFHEFTPDSHTLTFAYDANDESKYQLSHDFIDISQMPISGMFYYDELSAKIPAPKGIGMLIDDIPQSGADFLSDINGNYLLYSALGDQIFKVNNPIKSYNTGMQSLYFDGDSAYAKVDNIPNIDGKQGTWTGWLKKDNTNNAIQTILKIGNELALELHNNQNLVVSNISSHSTLIEINNVMNTPDWVFFALVYDANSLTLKTGGSDAVTITTDPPISGQSLLVGLQAETNAVATSFTGYIDQLEYRDYPYSLADLELIKGGDINPMDIQHLQLSYSFMGDDALYRAISRTPSANERVMNLHGATKVKTTYHTYSKDYKTVYVPDNDTESLGADTVNESYSSIILTPKSNLDFKITNRYGFTGHIQTPCGYGAGKWTGSIERTDLPPGYTFEKDVTDDHFNSDQTVFHIDDLIPGYYKVKLVNQDNGRELENFTPIKIDSANYVYDFGWQNPLSGSINIYTASQTGNYDSLLTIGCEGAYVLESGVAYELEIASFELYGTDQCYIDQIEYTASGDLGSLSEYTGAIVNNGKTRMPFTAGTPNYESPTTERKLSVTLTRTGGIVEQYNTDVNAYVTGSEISSPNFTIVNPDIITVLHDPPGDNSSVTLKAGTSINRTISHAVTGGVDTNFGVTFGNEYNNSVLVGGFVGGVINQLLKSRIEVTLSTNINHTEGGKWITEHKSELTTSITTNGAQNIVGEDADVFIGRGQIITRGQGRRVIVENCSPTRKDAVEVLQFGYTTPFYYTATAIKKVLQNQLDLIINDSSLSQGKKDTANISYQKWSTILTDNTNTINNIDNAQVFKEAFLSGYEMVTDTTKLNITDARNGVFSFGGGVAIGLDLTTNQTIGNTYNNSTTIGVGYESKSDISFAGFLAKLTSSVKLSVAHEYSEAYTEKAVKGYSITLSDDDILDHFSVKWKSDPKYGTPMFKTFAGQSKCPYEAGTENREGLEMIALDATDKTATTGQQIDYQLQLTNTQLAIDNQKKSYTLSLDNTSNNSGVTVLLNGAPFTVGQSFSLTKGGTATPVISVISNEAVDEEIILKFASSCESSGGSLIYSAAKLTNANLIAILTLTARFQAPCVEEIQMASPVSGYVVNSSSNNIPFKFKLVNPLDGLTDIMVEYRESGSSIIDVLSTITLTDNNKDVQDFYSNSMDVGALQDKKDYEFRLTPSCSAGTGEWGKLQTPSDWISISIDKEIPSIVTVNPVHNSQWTGGNTITVTYSKPLSTVVPNSIIVHMLKDDVSTPNITKTIAINENQLVITPTYTDATLEGAVITITIPGGEIKDTNGNPAAAYSWSFLVNKNDVTWTSTNKQLEEPQGTAIPFSMTIRNDGFINSTYQLQNLPSWLTVTNEVAGTVNTLYGSTGVGGYTHEVDFSISNALTEDTYNHIVQANTPGGVESFRLEVSVTPTTVNARISKVNPEFKLIASKVKEGIEDANTHDNAINHNDLLMTCYPNPFSEFTFVSFDLPQNTWVNVVVTDISGKLIKTLVKDELTARAHKIEWHVGNDNRIPSGIYIVKLSSGIGSSFMRVIL